MCAGKLMAYWNHWFLADTKGHFSLIQEVFEISTETRFWPDFFLMNVGDFFLRLLDAKQRKMCQGGMQKKLLRIPTVWSRF